MKLLYIVEDRFPPQRVDVVELFAVKMNEKGHQIDWFMPRGNFEGDGRQTIWHNQKVYLLAYLKGGALLAKIGNLLFATLGYFQIFALAFKNRYDVIQVRDLAWPALLGWLAARLTDAKFCYWMSFPFPEAKIYKARAGLARHRTAALVKGWSMWFLLYKVVFTLADRVFVQSEQMKADVIGHGIAEDRITPVLMGVRLDVVRTAEAARAPKTKRPLLLYLGTLERSRHMEMLVDMLAIVKRHFPGAMLRYVGGGDVPGDENVILARAKTQGVNDSVTTTGMLPMEEAWQHVEEADICFSPFYPMPILLSTSPTKLIEYLAMAKCVVANDHPEMTQVMRDSGVGQTVPWGADAFAAEVFRLLNDPAGSQDAAARGPDYVRSHRTYDVIAAKVDSAYRKLLSEGRAQT